ncbi:MAG: YihY/virulence factor BrkB family protein [Fibrobacter sp.]|nr:YihY/virulence factor BrkB family protein [Fibrobacter sp.]
MLNKDQPDSHGRSAEKPEQIPGRGWRDIGKRVLKENSKDNVGIIAAGIAFYAFLAMFPAIAATISIYGLVTDPQTVEQQLSELSNLLPPQSGQLVREQMSQIAETSTTALGWGLVLSVLLSLWSANKGTRALFQGLNIAYDEEDKRGFIKGNAITLLFTLYLIIAVIVSIVLVIALPAFAGSMGLPDLLLTALQWGKWVLLGAFVVLSLALLYRYAPDRDNPKWRWVSWGSVIGAFFWLVGSALFSLYVSNSGSYNATYGSLAAVVILLMWFFLSSYIILLGAEINSEIEHQTAKDSTVGQEKPMGRRGAYGADTLGEAT